jgi:hypothetical protein
MDTSKFVLDTISDYKLLSDRQRILQLQDTEVRDMFFLNSMQEKVDHFYYSAAKFKINFCFRLIIVTFLDSVISS